MVLHYKCYVRPTVEYATPIWMFDLSAASTNKLDKLQASAARAYLFSKTRHFPDWMTSKDALNKLCDWESLLWRRQILGLVYFHHLYHEYFTLLSDCKLVKSRTSRHPSLILPRSGSSFSNGFIFKFAVA